jgi:F-type H+-transporting ATPase subunit b
MAGETHAADAAGHAAEGAKGGFPPFDATLFSSQIFWFWVAFGALYIVLASVVIPRIAKTLAHRRGTIEGDLKAAADQTAQAQAARLQAEKASADARAQARKTVDEMRAINDAATAQAEAAANAAANVKIAAAEASIATSRAAAMTSINETIGDLAATIVERVSGATPTAKAISTALEGLSLEGVA